jgi:DNA-binding protein H-NS
MKSSKELLAEKAALDEAIARERKAASTQALRQIHEWINEFGFTAQQLIPWQAPKKHVSAKYLNPKTGDTWTGRGKPPAWIQGKDREQFLIEQPVTIPRQDGPYLAEMAAAAARQVR